MTHPKIGGPYVAHTREMLQSPAWRTLSLGARRLLDRIELEHLAHGGKDNGKLPVTFDQFVDYGIHRHAIAPGMRECSALGMLEITRQGCAGNAEFRSPNQFRITYLPSMGTIQPTNEWRSITTLDLAEALAREARKQPQNPRQQPPKHTRRSSPKNKIPVMVFAKSR